jgi:phosphatidylinositol-3-phosphatase
MPSPLVTAIAVMALLAFGVLVGSAVNPVTESAATAPLLVAVARTASSSGQPAAARSTTPPPSNTPEATPAAAPSESTGPEAAEPASSPATKPAAKTPTSTTKGSPPTSTTPGPTLPPISHIFLIVLSDQGFKSSFGPGSQAPYLSKTLAHQGELLDSYYAVAGGELANEIALISGQGPTPQTTANCPLYTDITPGTTGAEGQVLGSGCVYPSQTPTLGDQLTDEGKTWKTYVEGIGGPAQPGTCAHPTLGAADTDQAPTAASAYVTWRDPFAYFHSVIDSPSCASSVVGFEQLVPDLKATRTTPSLSYIIPSRCDDGSPEPCQPGAPSGLAAADTFLGKAVPEIESSPAFKAGGLIAITFDQAPQSGPEADSSSCCIAPSYPNLPAAVSEAPVTAGSTTAGSTTTTAAAGGGQVGLLLISKYVKPSSVNVTGEYNHFSLLASIEDLLGVSRLGYAKSQGLLVFDSSVYNAYP